MAGIFIFNIKLKEFKAGLTILEVWCMIFKGEKMKHKMPTTCPVCGKPLVVTELECEECSTTIKGRFLLDELLRLNPQQLMFLKVFIKNRGNLSDVQKELGISYPTARNRLDDIVATLGYEVRSREKDETMEVLDKLERGELSAEEALELLKRLKKGERI